MVHTADQWLRSAFHNTSLAVDQGAVQLAWQQEVAPSAAETLPEPTGLAFDPWCRLYRSIPEEGRVTRTRWGKAGPDLSTETDLFKAEKPSHGDFSPEKSATGPLKRPRSLVVDSQGCLFIAEAGGGLLIYDLLEQRLLRKLRLGNSSIPGSRIVDLACHGRRVYALLADPCTLIVLDARSAPKTRPLHQNLVRPSRLTVSPNGDLWLLDYAGKKTARVMPLDRPDAGFAIPDATDIAFNEQDVLVAARMPGQDFLCFRVNDNDSFALPHLLARHYNGQGIVRMPENGIGFLTDQGFRPAVRARMRYLPKGQVTTFRLDSNRFQTVWGRMFIDACIPKGTEVRVRCLALDEVPEHAERVYREPPVNTVNAVIHRPDLSPPMPPEKFLAEISEFHPLHRRSMGSEIPWRSAESTDSFVTYEAPVIAGPGRYLWVVLELKGTTRLTPKVRSLRIEYPAHDLLRRLPRIYSRDEESADFLRRYLAIMEGSMREIDLRAVYRHVLLNPEAAPQERLEWLAGFIGLALDKRWPLAAQRTLIRNGAWLFRFRGTVNGLKRFIEIYLGRSVEIVEHFKVRGLGGAIVGEKDALASGAVLGAGFRVGGKVGEAQAVSVNEERIEDAFDSHAHRFSLVIPISLDQEQREVIEHILALHRPCHTIYDICSVDAGMKAGIGLYLGLTTMVGRSSGFGELRAGASCLGRRDIIGRPGSGTRPGSSRVGQDSRVG
ncbi:MAG: phage tail protein [Candidatus Electrothrix communis]|nr:MAG: phage tail protein [Candidatus Electrothrix communis]